MEGKSVFEVLNAIDCKEHLEKKNGLTYLPWAWAWARVKEYYPDAMYVIYENAQGWNYHTDGRTCWVKTGVIIEGQEHIEYLPVMDYKNASIPADKVTSFDVNKAIQRSLTKAAARHGLGLYVYAGEDLPEASKSKEQEEFDNVLNEVQGASDLKELEGIYHKHEAKYKGNTVFVSKVTQKKRELEAAA